MPLMPNDEFFTDADGDGDKLVYSATSSDKSNVVVAALAKNGSAIYVDVLNPIGIHEFTITISVTDADGESAAEDLAVKVRIAPVLQQTYDVLSHPVDHSYPALTVGYRPGISHILNFVKGINFADVYAPD